MAETKPEKTKPLTPAEIHELQIQLAAQVSETQEQRSLAAQYAARVRAFDAILDDIVKTAQGNLVNRYGGYATAGYENAGCVHTQPTEEQRRAAELAALHERITDLDSRLLAVAAVATFAKGHKS